MTRALCFLAGCVLTAALLSGLAAVQRPACADDKPGDVDWDARLKAQATALAFLKTLEGTWDGVAQVMTAPGRPMVEAKGVKTVEMGCGGKWLIADFKMDMAGSPLHSHNVLGYDLKKGKYAAVWVDGKALTLDLNEGELDATGKVLTLRYEGPGLEGKPTRFTRTLTVQDPNTHLYTLSYLDAAGKEALVVTITFKRRR
ncbi:MAG: DUF1579 domain-containing protein [Planctomycetes bacterium]|nr:DUF1579 domain-containing protein [Planctomycetota bacterium]